MRAAIFKKPGLIEIEEKVLGEIGEEELLVRVKACGVCGTDIHIFHGEEGSAPVNPPIILGHEYSGEVVSIGKAVSEYRVGDRVAIDPNMYCGKCEYCRDHKAHFCNKLQALGVNVDGGFAEYCIVPTSQAYKFPDDLTYDEAAMVEPLACCLHGIDNACIKAGNSVAILGGGAIGLMMLQLAKLQGASFIAVSEPIESRRKLALKLGADIAVDPLNQELSAAIAEYSHEGVDIVIEASGKAAVIKQGIQIAKKGATLLIFSVSSPDAKFDFYPIDIFKKELTIKGSFINPGTHRRALSLIASRKINVKDLITHRFVLEDMTSAIKMQSSPEAIKVIVNP
jgi:L-iditol 2-dehydrogenase